MRLGGRAPLLLFFSLASAGSRTLGSEGQRCERGAGKLCPGIPKVAAEEGLSSLAVPPGTAWQSGTLVGQDVVDTFVAS